MATDNTLSVDDSDANLAELGARARADSIARAIQPKESQHSRKRPRAWKPVARFLVFTVGGLLIGAWAGSLIAPLGLDVSSRKVEHRTDAREFIVRTWSIRLTSEVHSLRAGYSEYWEMESIEQALKTKWERWLGPLGAFFGSLFGLAAGTAAVLGLEIVRIRERLATLERGRLKGPGMAPEPNP